MMVHRLGIVMFCSLVGGVDLAASAGEGLRFESLTVDLGTRDSLESIRHIFSFEVVGDRPIHIKEVRPSCGCLKPRLARTDWKPGERGEIELEIHAPSQSPGPHRYSLALTVLDPRPRTVTLNADVVIRADVTIQPSHLLVYLRGSDVLDQTITIVDRRRPPMRVTGIDSSSPRVSARVAKHDSATGHTTIEVAIQGNFPDGRHEDRLLVHTDDRAHASIAIPLVVVRNPRVLVKPESLHLAVGSQRTRAQLLLLDQKQSEVLVSEVTSSQPELQCDWPKTPTARPRIQLEWTGPRVASPVSAWVRIAIRQPVETELEVPVKID